MEDESIHRNNICRTKKVEISTCEVDTKKQEDKIKPIGLHLGKIRITGSPNCNPDK